MKNTPRAGGPVIPCFKYGSATTSPFWNVLRTSLNLQKLPEEQISFNYHSDR